MNVAAIDVGTNTALMVVATWQNGRLVSRYEEGRYVRLGEGVDATRRINPAALQRLRTVLLDYRSIIEEMGVEAVVLAGTSASRDAENQDELIRFVREEVGWTYEILSGEEEALLSFTGAASSMETHHGTMAVFDIGGGSTEIIFGHQEPGQQAELTFRVSLNMGTVRLVERFFSTQPPVQEEVEAAQAFMDILFSQSGLPSGAGVPLIGAAGTPVVLTLLHHGASAWKELGVPLATLEHADVSRWRAELLASSREKVLRLNPSIMKGREDLLPMGALMMERIMTRLGAASCIVSPRGLRHGLALRYFEGKAG